MTLHFALTNLYYKTQISLGILDFCNRDNLSQSLLMKPMHYRTTLLLYCCVRNIFLKLICVFSRSVSTRTTTRELRVLCCLLFLFRDTLSLLLDTLFFLINRFQSQACLTTSHSDRMVLCHLLHSGLLHHHLSHHYHQLVQAVLILNHHSLLVLKLLHLHTLLRWANVLWSMILRKSSRA